METSELLEDAFSRIGASVAAVLDAVGTHQLNWRPGGSGNSIAWLLWHLCRIQDEQLAELAHNASVWASGGYAARFGFDLDPADTGYGHSLEQVSAVRLDSTELLREYHEAVLAASLEFVRTVAGAALDQVVDRRWDPPVTLGVRLISIVDDCLQHGGQAAYILGLPTGS